VYEIYWADTQNSPSGTTSLNAVARVASPAFLRDKMISEVNGTFSKESSSLTDSSDLNNTIYCHSFFSSGTVNLGVQYRCCESCRCGIYDYGEGM